MIIPPLDVDAAARLSKVFRLRDVVCLGIDAKHLSSNPPAEVAGLGWEAPELQAIWDLGEGTLKVLLPLHVFIDAYSSDKESGGSESSAETDNSARETTEKQAKNRVAELSVLLRIEYEVKPDAPAWSEVDVPHYAGITSFLHAWSYFRADIQMLTTKLGFPPLTLPVVTSGYPAKRVNVSRLGEMKQQPLPRRKPKKKLSQKQ